MVADPRFIPREGRTANPHNAFTLAERDRRWSATRQAMEERGIDCPFIVGKGWNEVGNCRWLDNNDHIERHLVFPLRGNPVLLWLLGGFLPLQQGGITANGRDVTGPGADRGIVFQHFALFPWKTVRDNVLYGLEKQRLARDERLRIAQEFIDLVHLTGFEDAFPRSFRAA